MTLRIAEIPTQDYTYAARMDGWLAPLTIGYRIQFRARAIMRAVVVLPTPLTPVETEGMGDPPSRKSIGQGTHQRFLANKAESAKWVGGIFAPAHGRAGPA